MIINKCLVNNLFKINLISLYKIPKANIFNRARTGNRDWVGFGINGTGSYTDDPCFPLPGIRFKENTNELLALREKEKGDWRKLTLEEKKTLYRASFRQTFEEVMAPTGEWKCVLAAVLFGVGLSLWFYSGMKLFCFPDLPITFSEEYKSATLRRLLDLRVGHITGISSKWDYEKDDWKK